MQPLSVWLLSGFGFQAGIALLFAGVLTALWRTRRVPYLMWSAASWWFFALYLAAGGLAFYFVVEPTDSHAGAFATFFTQFAAVACALLLVAAARVLAWRTAPDARWLGSGIVLSLLSGAASVWWPGVNVELSAARIILRNTLPGFALVAANAYVLLVVWRHVARHSVGTYLLSASLSINVLVNGAELLASVALIFKRTPEMYSTYWFPLMVITQAMFGIGWVVLLLETERHERAATEEQLVRADALLRQAFEASDDLIGVVDAQERLVICNTRMAETIRAVTGRAVTPLMAYPRPGRTEDERRAFFNTILRALKGETVSERNALVTLDGQRIVLDRHIVPIREGNTVTGCFVVARDVTADEALRGEAERAMRIEAMARMAGGLAHDFNNILTVVQTNLQLMAEDREHDLEMMDMLMETAGALDRANVLTRRLLGVARDRASVVTATDVATLLRDFSRFLQHAVGDEVVLTLKLPSTPPVVLIDAGRLEQVLLNLSLNARDAMPHGGSLCIAVTIETVATGSGGELRLPAGPYVTIRVADDGHGMDAATLARAGDPFFTTKPGTSGSGLGLATCRALVSDANGAFSMSSAPGAGTTVTIRLPLHDAAKA